ncbi:hypothetical protein [Rugamonas aquatica]|uniref:Uncharacterized protein n=1 Tax=Rugamonas aquatica TaxID=2743357 RepID=A0A6A7N950_9BURK|nr:hypothetical protein [Rugamonas aquatica]MQA41392.1 hypothetical protein [Rugamonas aquatica]
MARSADLIKALRDVVERDKKSSNSIIGNFLTKAALTGGWESWLQVEFAAQVLETIKFTAFSREQAYPVEAKGAGKKYDLCFIGASGGVPIYAELKTQRTSAYLATLDDFDGDILKIQSFDADWKSNNMLFAAAILTARADDVVQLDKLRKKDMTRYRFAHYDNDGWTVDDSNNSIPPAVKGKLVMVVWCNT